MKHMILLSALAASFGAAAAVPTVGSVSFAQDPATLRVAVTYALTGADGIVTLDVLTNGVSIGGEHLRKVYGDVNRKIAASDATTRTIWWVPDRDWPGLRIADGSLSVSVRAWSPANPPPYMAICLAATNAPVLFYPSEGAVAEGVTADRYKTQWLLMRKIEAAGKTWRMGAPTTETGYLARNVPHLVTLTNDYYLGVYEFTQKQYHYAYKGLGATAESPSSDPSVWRTASDRDMRPVENRAWLDLRGDGKGDTKDYTWPGEGHAVNPSYLLGRMRKAWGMEFDLPTEAQWEYACRAGCGDVTYVWGADVGDLAWYAANSEIGGVVQTHVVGLKRPNAFGLYDMIGNVQEWVLDMTGTMAYNPDGTPVLEPVGTATGTGNRVRKGCSYEDPLSEARSSFYDDSYSQAGRNAVIGFRLCCPATLD